MIGTLAKIKGIWKTFTRKTESPREIQERNDLYKIALAATYRQLRATTAGSHEEERKACDNHPRPRQCAAVNDHCYYHYCRDDKTQLESLYDQATDSLEHETRAHELPIRSLRLHVQSLVQPQALDMIKTCRDVDEELQIPQDDEIHNDVLYKCRDIVQQERLQVRNILEDACKYSHNVAATNVVDATSTTGDASLSLEAKRQERQRSYLQQKLDAIDTLWNFFEWQSDSNPTRSFTNHAVLEEHGKADAFGYYINSNENINRSIRYYQLINLTKAILIKQRLGFASLALGSTLPNAGRGIFLDGFVPAGSLVAFFPGMIWPKEHLANVNSVKHIFKDDPRHHLSMRYDDILVDSRKEPYTVLDNDNSNAFAIAHVANHPRMQEEPNCGTVMVDFLEKEKWNDLGLARYVPNTYAKPPMMLGPQALDLEKVYMHGFGLVAARDLENEELFYDYRLSPGDEESSTFPEWYHVCNPDDVRNRWSTS
jgi:hypothetical protein